MEAMWCSLVREMRSSWENLRPIPGVEGYAPDWNYCIIYQKMQMVGTLM